MLLSYSKHIITAFLLIQFHAPCKRFCSTDLDFVQIFRNFLFNLFQILSIRFRLEDCGGHNYYTNLLMLLQV